MVSLIVSLVILCAPIIMSGVVIYWLWCQGLLGKLCLIACLGMLAAKAHAIVYPEKMLQEKYRELLR